MKSRGGGWSSETGKGIDRLRRKPERERPVKRAKKSRRGRKEGTGAREDSVPTPSAGVSAAAPQRSAPGCPGREGLQGAVASLPPNRRPPPPPPPPHLAQGGRNGVGARGLFGAVRWKIDFNPLCGYKGARSALAD